MKKLVLSLVACLAAVATIGSLAACGEKEPPKPTRHEHSYVNGVCECGAYEVGFLGSLPMAQDLQAACDQQGTVVDFTYETRAYAIEAIDDSDAELPVTKTAQIYLPYGYDEAKQYNVLYLMHGGGETYSYWLTKMGTTTKNVLDNLVKAGKCEPTIVVCPTFESKPEGYNDLFRAADWTRYYPLELRNDLIAAVETEYSTYLGDDASYENMVATRDHRGFAGFSMGSMTSLQVMTQCSDLVSYIGSYSASMYADRTGAEAWEEIKAGITRDEVKNYKINYWFNMNGTADMALGPHEQLNEAVMADKDGLFTNGVNYAWILVPGGSHAYNCWVMGLYDCMLVFFK